MTTTKVLNFTLQSIEQLPLPEKGKAFYRDSKERGLSLYVTAHGAKTFFVRKRVNGRDSRIGLGSPDYISVETARRKARVIKGQVAEGLDPRAEKRKSLSSKLTLGKHYKDYMDLYSKVHKKSWQYDEREIPKFLSHWFNRRLNDISKYEVQKLHQKIFDENGLYQANRVIERLKALYNKAIEWGWEGVNPASKIKRYKEKSRDRFILPEEMPFLVKSLNEELNETARDIFWILLLTGVRKTNALMMRWGQITWETKSWHIPDTKNGDSLVLPLLDRVVDILKKRKESSDSEWVFPSETNPKKHFINTKRAWKRTIQRATIYFWESDEKLKPLIEMCRAKIANEFLVDQWFNLIVKHAEAQKVKLPTALMDIRLHDIRRTFGSYQAIMGSSLLIIGKSLGHKSPVSTQVYARLNLDPVRHSIEKATNAMFN